MNYLAFKIHQVKSSRVSSNNGISVINNIISLIGLYIKIYIDIYMV
jgi:hypothetical protein